MQYISIAFERKMTYDPQVKKKTCIIKPNTKNYNVYLEIIYAYPLKPLWTNDIAKDTHIKIILTFHSKIHQLINQLYRLTYITRPGSQ